MKTKSLYSFCYLSCLFMIIAICTAMISCGSGSSEVADLPLPYDPPAVRAPQIGDLYGSDGETYANKDDMPTDVTPIGIVVYLGTETGETGFSHGLVMSLKTISNEYGTEFLIWQWSTEYWISKVDFSWSDTHSALPRCDTKATAMADMDGLANTAVLENCYKTGVHMRHDIAEAMALYNKNIPTPMGTKSTKWFVPSIGQWYKALGESGIGKLSEYNLPFLGKYMNDESISASINAALAKAGAGNFDKISGGGIWTSSEYYCPEVPGAFAIHLSFGDTRSFPGYSAMWVLNARKDGELSTYAFLAF